MKYALGKFRVHLLGSRPFVIYTDHGSLRTATNSPHLSQRMARWLSFFAEYNFRVEYKPGKLNFLSDGKDVKIDRLSPRQRAQIHRYELVDGLLHYRVDPGDPPQVDVPNDEDLKYDILLEAHDAPINCWKSMSLDFVFGLPADDKSNTGILVFVCRLSKIVHHAPVRDEVTRKQAAQLFLDSVFRYHGLPEIIVSDRDPRFTGAF
ncbi:Reverse transcriptase [Phytophthora palmivora]|uniref:Reverse transcriptase n=1 Tax=Phytophthora palmivora TaxID=4796 RepID=A0A2P4XP99_9STRA|nr:Reverse transcriptase [Phytophthora palmivora]